MAPHRVREQANAEGVSVRGPAVRASHLRRAAGPARGHLSEERLSEIGCVEARLLLERGQLYDCVPVVSQEQRRDAGVQGLVLGEDGERIRSAGGGRLG